MTWDGTYYRIELLFYDLGNLSENWLRNKNCTRLNHGEWWQHCSKLGSSFLQVQVYNSITEYTNNVLKSPERIYRNWKRARGVIPWDLFHFHDWRRKEKKPRTQFKETAAKQNTNMKTKAFIDTAPCSVVEVDQRFRDAYCLYHQGTSRQRGTMSQKAVIFITAAVRTWNLTQKLRMI
jgi:hypothetical protein